MKYIPSKSIARRVCQI